MNFNITYRNRRVYYVSMAHTVLIFDLWFSWLFLPTVPPAQSKTVLHLFKYVSQLSALHRV